MNIGTKALSAWCGLTLCVGVADLHAQFDVITAGAASPSPNSKLTFTNGASFAAGSGYAHKLTYTAITNFGVTNVIYSSTNLQFFCLSATNVSGPITGAFVVCEVQSVTGPVGGALTFWEQGWRTPTYNFPVGVSPVIGSNRFDISDISLGAGQPDGDPVGRIPVRRFTANKAGDYFLTVKLIDISTNTAAAGPMHSASDPITLKFTTGVDLAVTRVAVTNAVTTLTFRQGSMTNLIVEANTNVAGPNWVAVAGPFTNAPYGTNTTTLRVTNSAELTRFYRLHGATP